MICTLPIALVFDLFLIFQIISGQAYCSRTAPYTVSRKYAPGRYWMYILLYVAFGAVFTAMVFMPAAAGR